MRNILQQLVYQWQKLISIILLLLLGLSIAIFPASSQTPQCIHGMRIIGEKTIYLTHMPLFNSQCHSYQVILEATFTGDGNPQDKYLTDQAQNLIQNEYTLEPTEQFWLPGLESGRIKSFKANIHRGQYERNSTPQLLAKNVTVEVKRIVHFRKFEPKVNASKLTQYLLFGNVSEQYLAHLITSPPDLDQILSVDKPLTSLGNVQIPGTIRLVLPERTITSLRTKLQQALKPNDETTVLINGKGQPLKIKAGAEYFFETDDLKS
jgi:hypothetical protein